MAADYREDIDALLRHLQPHSMLLVGEDSRTVAGDYLAGCEDCRVEAVAVDDLPGVLASVGRFEFALIDGELERLARADAAIVLGRLRDLHAERLLWVLPAAEWPVSELLSLGLYRAGSYEQDGRALHVYTFDLYDYKPTPDWLNSRYWAHPELFDKFWW